LLPAQQRAEWLASLTKRELEALQFTWSVWARPDQLPPEEDFFTWLILAGRGWGKTRTGGEWIRDGIENEGIGRVALVARTAADARDVMVEGESGLLAICPPWNKPKYFPSKRRLVWPNGAIATLYSADEPDLLRGPQHDRAWADEVATWRYVQETWSNLMMGLRLGERPQVAVTTTPRSIKIIKELRASPTTATTRGRTADNTPNLAPTFLTEVVGKYQGTRLGRQELEGELLEDTPGALWTRAMLDGVFVREAPALRRVVVAIDPAVSSGEDSDETGIVVVGTDGQRGYVLADLSGRYTPAEWARRALEAYRTFKADRIIAEVNNGGALVEANLSSFKDDARGLNGKNVPFKAVHASRGKAIRAEPISGLYEQRRVSHVGAFPQLEDQLCTWSPEIDARSPDRLDALVWGLTELMLSGGAAAAPSSLNKHLDKFAERRFG
jgi:phage terminase large subunit-like protein